MARYINEIDLPPGFRPEDVELAGADRERVLEAFLSDSWEGIGIDWPEDEHGRTIALAVK